MTTWYYTNIVLIQSTFTTLLLALSLQVPMRVGVFSFAGVGCFGLGGYAAAIAMTRFDMSTAESVAVGTALAGVAALLLGLLVQRLTGLYLAMATVAFTLIVSVVAVNGGDLTGGAGGIFGALGDLQTWHLLVAAVVVVALLAMTERGAIGRRVEAVRENPELAASFGINVTRYRVTAFTVSGVLGGLSGAFTILLRSTVTPDAISFHLIVLALTVIIVGGWTSWLGALVGSVIFVWLPSMLDFVGDWEAVVYGAIVALAAVFLPEGVVGLIGATVRRLRRVRRRAGGAGAVPAAAPDADLPDAEAASPAVVPPATRGVTQ